MSFKRVLKIWGYVSYSCSKLEASIGVTQSRIGLKVCYFIIYHYLTWKEIVRYRRFFALQNLYYPDASGGGGVTFSHPPIPSERLNASSRPLLHLNPPLQSFYSGCTCRLGVGYSSHRFAKYYGEIKYTCSLWKTSLHHLLNRKVNTQYKSFDF